MGAPQESVVIHSRDSIELSGWWIQGTHPTSVAVLCHGYVLTRGELAPIAFSLWQQGFSCLLFDFRSHGKSKGGKCSFGFHERFDVLSALEWVKDRNPQARTVLIGSSMGSVASAMSWAENPELADALVLDSAYANLGKAVGGWWHFVGGKALAAFLWPAVGLGGLFLGFNPFSIHLSDWLERLKGRPVLFLHGTDDLVAPAAEAGKNLFALGSSCESVWFEGCGHSEGRWEQPDRYREALLRFLSANGFFESKGREIDGD